jgi:hypothetical protein
LSSRVVDRGLRMSTSRESTVLTAGLYRDKNGRTAHVRTTSTGYLISYTDGPPITLPLPESGQPAPDRPLSASRTR